MPPSLGAAPPPIDTRSFISVVVATFQPSPTSPIRSVSGIATSVRKTSLNSASPVACRSGLTSTPGTVMSQAKYVSPWCLGTSGSVRATSSARLARCADDVHTFCPFTTHPG